MFCQTFCVFLAIFLASQHYTAAEPVVETINGLVEGKTELFAEDDFINVNKSIDVYRGIPFAEPPIGMNRFRAPLPAKSWNGIYNATDFRMACPQPFISFSGIGEDCLYLNVYVPHTIVSINFEDISDFQTQIKFYFPQCCMFLKELMRPKTIYKMPLRRICTFVHTETSVRHLTH